jgi:hypothetical protein
MNSDRLARQNCLDAAARSLPFGRATPWMWITPVCAAIAMFVMTLTGHAATVVMDLTQVDDPELRQVLVGAFNLPHLFPPEKNGIGASPSSFISALEDEKARISSLLRSFGYLRAGVLARYQRQSVFSHHRIQSLQYAPQRNLVVVQVRPGPLFRIGAIELSGLLQLGLAPQEEADLRDILPQYTGKSASGEILTAIEDQILYRIRLAGRPLAGVTNRQLILDSKRNLVTVQVIFDIGRHLTFGALTFRGLHRITPDVLNKYLPFSPGDAFQFNKLDDLQKALMSVGIFDVVEVRAANKADNAGRLPVEVMVVEKRPTGTELDNTARPSAVATVVLVLALLLRQIITGFEVPRSVVRVSNVMILICLAITGGLWFIRAHQLFTITLPS